MYIKQASQHWKQYQDYSGGFINEGFPFNEGFPKIAYDIPNAHFELVLRTGERCTAIVDYLMQYRAEGLEWLTLTATKNFAKETHLGNQLVVAWREL
jgi:hypothetical protein